MKYLNYLIIMIFINGSTGKAQGVSSGNEDVAATIIALEKGAMELWSKGNPDGFLELTDEDVVYMDPYFDLKLEGKKALEDYYNSLRGQVNFDSCEMIRPVVQLTTELAVLIYNFTSTGKEGSYRWNCTEVYRLNPEGEWRIIHTHWSLLNVHDLL